MHQHIVGVRQVMERERGLHGAHPALRVLRGIHRLLRLGFEPAGGTPESLAKLEGQERAKWAPLIKAAGLKGD